MRLGPLLPGVGPAPANPSGTAVATTAAPTIVAPLATPTAAATPAALPDLAATLGLPPGDTAAAVVSALIRDGLPLTPAVAQRVLTLWRDSGLPTPAAAALLWLGERRIPATLERVRLIEAFRAANLGSDGPPPDTLLLTARLIPNQQPVVTAWPWLVGPLPAPQPSLAAPAPSSDRPSAVAPDDSAATQSPAATRIALLLSVDTVRFGTVEALVTTVGERVEVTFFSDQPVAVAALASQLPVLGAALIAAGLLPTDLTALLATAGSAAVADGEPGLTRLDVRA